MLLQTSQEGVIQNIIEQYTHA